MKPVRIAPPASEEFSDAVRWYEGKRTGLGGEFYDAVSYAVDLVHEHPEIGVKLEGSSLDRELLVGGFPYKVIYRDRTDDLYIVAIAHTSRRPGYWKQR